MAACQWLGTEVVSSVLLDKMPDAMRKDVEKAAAANPAKPKPTRLTRKAAKAAPKEAPREDLAEEPTRTGTPAEGGPSEYPEGGLPPAGASAEESDDDDPVRFKPQVLQCCHSPYYPTTHQALSCCVSRGTL